MARREARGGGKEMVFQKRELSSHEQKVRQDEACQAQLDDAKFRTTSHPVDRTPTAPPVPAKATISEVQDLEAFRRALNSRWDNVRDQLINRNAPEMKQVARLLGAHLAEALGGNDYEYAVGAFTGRDLPGRQADGWVKLTWPDLEKFGLWSDNTALSFGVQNAVDGLVRWGSRGELIVCYIRKDAWIRRQEQQERESEEMFSRALPKKAVSTESGEETTAEIAKEQVNTRSRGSVKK
jgi:hypothetical protein